MIPHGHPVMTEEDIAAARGLDLKKWRRQEGAAFRARVPVVNPGKRPRFYNAAQATAAIKGLPIPAAPAAGAPHPEDLLSDVEAGAVIGINDSTVRDYAASGYMHPGIELHGRRWWTRRMAEERRDAERQPGAGGGWQSGDPRNTGRPATPDPRIGELAHELNRTQQPPTTAEVAARYNVSKRTAQRLLVEARQHAGDRPAAQ
ncbi:DNA-binding protein [Streptomyces sp. NBC_01244]|uniref:DNA-binding protein n=1 Tax=Streptomyces sp. NBC_01244 TaxID=2903797 RepID=UPI002E0D6416|nr:DNA-binding protein [Streptomyces sp. NBC_01244]